MGCVCVLVMVSDLDDIVLVNVASVDYNGREHQAERETGFSGEDYWVDDIERLHLMCAYEELHA